MEKIKNHNKKVKIAGKTNGHDSGKENSRIEVLKTYKIFIGGKFPRTESGRYYFVTAGNGKPIANACKSSRKDFRDAVVSARNCFEGWSSMAVMNRGQILYRLAEMIEGRKEQFVTELIAQGATTDNAKEEVELSIDRLVYYAGWCDKFQQLFSTVNPVASPHFNFSRPEPTGVVAILAPEDTSLLGLISVIAPALAGGNTIVALASERKPLCSITFAEVVNTSDVPGGVINILTGSAKELYPHVSSHMDVNAVIYCGNDQTVITEIQKNSTCNVKRAIIHRDTDWMDEKAQNPYRIMNTQEIKTTWHPVGI